MTVNTSIVLSTTNGVRDADLLVENGGNIYLSKDWTKLLSRMGFVKCKAATSKVTISPAELESLKVQFLNDISTFVTLEEILMELIITWDHHLNSNQINFIPLSNWTRDKQGIERIQWGGLAR